MHGAVRTDARAKSGEDWERGEKRELNVLRISSLAFRDGGTGRRTLAFIFLLRFTWKSSSRKRNRDNTSAKLASDRRNDHQDGRRKGQGTWRTDEGVLRDCKHGGPAASASYPRLGGAYARTTIRAPLRAAPSSVFVPKTQLMVRGIGA
ncbi:hypothetical protein ALC57_18299 [Trachymyrmex cornetzi]|uniref:Uncharacterized protein n=1 Tax=Trachymyrmex cornetzi TaxID=471704 RepID=A0A151ISC4_9HYME|nr:hypothetical protein ALC57_18299 [Trachymyrmex cornetzi]